MIAGYAAFVPGLAIVYFHNRWTRGWPALVTVMGWLSLVVGLVRMVFPTQIAALTTKIAPAAAGVFTCRRGRIPADRRVPFVQGIRSRVTTAAVLGGSATGPLALREFSPPRKSGLPCQCPAMPNGRCRIHGGKSPSAPRGNKHSREASTAFSEACTAFGTGRF